MNKPLKKDEIHLSEELLSKAFQLYASEHSSPLKERMQAYLMWSSEEFEEDTYAFPVRESAESSVTSELAQFDPELEFEQGLQVIVRRFIVYVTKRPKLFEALPPPPIVRYARSQQVVVDTREDRLSNCEQDGHIGRASHGSSDDSWFRWLLWRQPPSPGSRIRAPSM